ncbi:unnamed protein product, partial [Mesorhabditis spiculigera]
MDTIDVFMRTVAQLAQAAQAATAGPLVPPSRPPTGPRGRGPATRPRKEAKPRNNRGWTETPTRGCPTCGGRHGLASCRSFAQMSGISRWRATQARKLCFLCLQSGHTAASCGAPRCPCGAAHHAMLCRAPPTAPDADAAQMPEACESGVLEPLEVIDSASLQFE